MASISEKFAMESHPFTALLSSWEGMKMANKR